MKKQGSCKPVCQAEIIEYVTVRPAVTAVDPVVDNLGPSFLLAVSCSFSLWHLCWLTS